MMDEGRISLELARAAQAERLLADDIFKDALNAVKAKYEADWLGSRLDDTQKRERCFLAMRALADVIRHIEMHVATGKLAKAEVKNKSKVN
jgi:hypothetical protein